SEIRPKDPPRNRKVFRRCPFDGRNNPGTAVRGTAEQRNCSAEQRNFGTELFRGCSALSSPVVRPLKLFNQWGLCRAELRNSDLCALPHTPCRTGETPRSTRRGHPPCQFRGTVPRVP